MWTQTFWRQALERAIKSLAQSMILAFAGSEVNVLTLDWKTLLGAGLGGMLLSLLTSIASVGIGPSDSPSLVPTN